MKSIEEIRERLEEQKNNISDAMMWKMSNYHPLCIFLEEYIKEGYEPNPLTREEVLKEMSEYMPFAIMKAKDQRGLSAARSIWKYEQWLWVLEDPLYEEIGIYDDYGMEHLHKIAGKYDLPLKEEEE